MVSIGTSTYGKMHFIPYYTIQDHTDSKVYQREKF